MNDAKTAAVRAVIGQLDSYGGEPIEKDAHPLWFAAVVLERLGKRNPNSKTQPYRLDTPNAHGRWMCLLWASRDGSPNIPRGKRIIEVDKSSLSTHENPRLAMYWAVKLREILAAELGKHQ